MKFRVSRKKNQPVASYKTLYHQGRIFTWWLGQAGFLLKYNNINILIDPYFSDALAKKYKGTEYPHSRLMPPPVSIDSLSGIDAIFCTHAHSDHMDPEIFPYLLKNNPELKIIIPGSTEKVAIERGAVSKNLILMDDEEEKALFNDLKVTAIASAHEELEVNEKNQNLYLGYIMDFNGFLIYHSGDCCIYEGLVEKLNKRNIHLALLPVNGRGKAKNIKGNFTFSEAVFLSKKCHIQTIIVNHFGMFDFNTVSNKYLKLSRLKYTDNSLQIVIPVVNDCYIIEPEAE